MSEIIRLLRKVWMEIGQNQTNWDFVKGSDIVRWGSENTEKLLTSNSEGIIIELFSQFDAHHFSKGRGMKSTIELEDITNIYINIRKGIRVFVNECDSVLEWKHHIQKPVVVSVVSRLSVAHGTQMLLLEGLLVSLVHCFHKWLYSKIHGHCLTALSW